jgi:hypothetical protein
MIGPGRLSSNASGGISIGMKGLSYSFIESTICGIFCTDVRRILIKLCLHDATNEERPDFAD